MKHTGNVECKVLDRDMALLRDEETHGNNLSIHMYEERAKDIVLRVNAHDDLLEACKHALRVFDLYKNHPQMDTIRKVLSEAIAKAEDSK